MLGGLTVASPDEWLRAATAVLRRAERDDPNAAWLAESVLKHGLPDGWTSLTDRRGAITAAARAIAVLERRRRLPDAAEKLGRTRRPRAATSCAASWRPSGYAWPACGPRTSAGWPT